MLLVVSRASLHRCVVFWIPVLIRFFSLLSSSPSTSNGKALFVFVVKLLCGTLPLFDWILSRNLRLQLMATVASILSLLPCSGAFSSCCPFAVDVEDWV